VAKPGEKLRLPPRIKVLEALSAVADGRVRELGSGKALVASSDASRSYEVFVDTEKRLAYSTDNGTTYKGYVGYPIIALLMKLGALPYDQEAAEKLRGINWRKLNEQYKSYALVESEVKKIFAERGGDVSKLDKLVERVLGELKKLGLVYALPSGR